MGSGNIKEIQGNMIQRKLENNDKDVETLKCRVQSVHVTNTVTKTEKIE